MEIIAGILGGLVLYAGFEALFGIVSSSASIASQTRMNELQRQQVKAMEEARRKGAN